ncbi:mor transcription activator family protein [Pasteurellaceae bacterium 15-036681]|nr:mor transcription activator family protein [Pasteurellaceae bacterium 15-036681]
MCELESVADYLPPIVLEIVDIIGFRETEKLIRKLGGAPIRFSCGAFYFPKVADAVGVDNAKELRYYFGGKESVYIPRCETALRMLRNQRFKSEFDSLREKGMSGRMIMVELCPKFGISDRQGWDVIHSFNQQKVTQDSLF